jgi:hypothetical protein
MNVFLVLMSYQVIVVKKYFFKKKLTVYYLRSILVVSYFITSIAIYV